MTCACRAYTETGKLYDYRAQASFCTLDAAGLTRCASPATQSPSAASSSNAASTNGVPGN